MFAAMGTLVKDGEKHLVLKILELVKWEHQENTPKDGVGKNILVGITCRRWNTCYATAG